MVVYILCICILLSGVYVCVYIYKYIYAWAGSDRQIKLSCETNSRCSIQESVLDETGGMVDFDVGPESTYGLITDSHGLSLFGWL